MAKKTIIIRVPQSFVDFLNFEKRDLGLGGTRGNEAVCNSIYKSIRQFKKIKRDKKHPFID